MLNNYFKIAIRTFSKYKGYTLVNLIGLSLGLLVGVMVLIFVLDELSFDQFHAKKDRTYRVITTFYSDKSSGSPNETNGWPVGKVLETEYPEVEAVLYTRSASNLLVNFEEKRIRQQNLYATPEFFEIFSFPLKKGNSKKALLDPFSIVISEDMERKYFGDESGFDKILTLGDTLNFRVTGVMANIPVNSHIQVDMVLSFSTYQRLQQSYFSFDTGWGNINMYNYVLLKEHSDFSSFSAKAKNIYHEKAGEMLKNWGVSAAVEFEPLGDIYLKTKCGNRLGTVGSLARVKLLAGIGVFVIILACINFINLATARSVQRAKEVGIRKVSGSTRQALIGQFLWEAIILVVAGFILASFLIWTSLPIFNELLNKNYSLSGILDTKTFIGIGLLLVLLSFLSGYYPAMYLSALRPVDVLKGKFSSGKGGVKLRRVLVVFQFIISICLITGTVIITEQLGYMQKQNLGFNKDQVLIVNAARSKSKNQNASETFKDQLRNLAGVKDVTYTNALPSMPGWLGQIAYPEGKSGADAKSVEYMAIDDSYINVLGLQLVAGRGFNKNILAELNDGLIINETAVSVFGWSSPIDAIGKKIESPSGYPAGEVIGVVKDFHQSGLQKKIGPVAMDYAPGNSYLFAILYQASETSTLISSINELWNQTYSGYDFNYLFLDESFEKQYVSETRLAKVFSLFSTLAIIIGIIGLLGLVAYMIESRTKEIGIRKVIGADVFTIVRLLSFEFIVLVLLANFISIPLTVYFANQWLERFAFRMELTPSLFIISSLLIVGATIIAVSFQTIKAAVANPVNSLRTE